MNWKTLQRKMMKDPEFVKEVKKLEPEYQLARSLIGARIKKKLTQKSLATKAKTDQASISRLESGTSKPSLTLLRKIATALDANLMIRFET